MLPSRVFPTPSLLPRVSGFPRGKPSDRGLRSSSLLSRSPLTRTHLPQSIQHQPTIVHISQEGSGGTGFPSNQPPPTDAPCAAKHVKRQGTLLPLTGDVNGTNLFDTSLFESAQPVFMGRSSQHSPEKSTKLHAGGEHTEDLHPNVPSSPRHPLMAAAKAEANIDEAIPPINTRLAHCSTRKTSSRSPSTCAPSPTLSASPCPDSTAGGTLSQQLSFRHAYSCDPSPGRGCSPPRMASSAAMPLTAADSSLSTRFGNRRDSAVDRTVADSDDELMMPAVSADETCSDSMDLSPMPVSSFDLLGPWSWVDTLVGKSISTTPPLSITTGEVTREPQKPRESLSHGRSRNKRRRRRKTPRCTRALRPNILIHSNYNPHNPSSEYENGTTSSTSSTHTSPNQHGYISDSPTASLSPSPRSTVPTLYGAADTSSVTSDFPDSKDGQPSRKKQRTISYTGTDSSPPSSPILSLQLDSPLTALTSFPYDEDDADTASSSTAVAVVTLPRQQELFIEHMPLDVMAHSFSWFYLEEVAGLLPVSTFMRDVGQAVLARSRTFDDMGFPLDSRYALQALIRAGACRLRKLVLLTRGTDQQVICNLFASSSTLRYVEIDSWMLTEPMIPLLASTKLEVLNISGPSVPRVVRALRAMTGLRALFLDLSIFSEKDECRLARATCNVIAACPQLRAIGTSFSLLHCAKASVRLPQVTHVILPSLSRMLAHAMPNLEELCVWYPHDSIALSPSKFLKRLAELKNLTTLYLCFASVPCRNQIRAMFSHIEDFMPTLRTLVCSIDAPSVSVLSEAVESARLSGGGGLSPSSSSHLSHSPAWLSFLSSARDSTPSSPSPVLMSTGSASTTTTIVPSPSPLPMTGRASSSSQLLLCPTLTVRVGKVDNMVSRLCQHAGIDMEALNARPPQQPK